MTNAFIFSDSDAQLQDNYNEGSESSYVDTDDLYDLDEELQDDYDEELERGIKEDIDMSLDNEFADSISSLCNKVEQALSGVKDGDTIDKEIDSALNNIDKELKGVNLRQKLRDLKQALNQLKAVVDGKCEENALEDEGEWHFLGSSGFGSLKGDAKFDSAFEGFGSSSDSWDDSVSLNDILEHITNLESKLSSTAVEDYMSSILHYLEKFDKQLDNNTMEIKFADDSDTDHLAVQLICRAVLLPVETLKCLFTDRDIGLLCIDGSSTVQKSGYAYSLIYNGQIRDVYNECPEPVESLGAEIYALRYGLAAACATGLTELFIVYDCENMYREANTPSSSLGACVNSLSGTMRLHWIKVKGHSGVPIHTRVDVHSGLVTGRKI